MNVVGDVSTYPRRNRCIIGQRRDGRTDRIDIHLFNDLGERWTSNDIQRQPNPCHQSVEVVLSIEEVEVDHRIAGGIDRDRAAGTGGCHQSDHE